jgi:hypothetical protein
LFQGFKGTATSIITVVNGFLTICAGVVLLQLSKSAKDVPDAAVFSGDLDQIHTIAEQEQPESEPKADAIRGAAAIVRRFSVTRQKMELDELKRLHQEKMSERLAPVSEDGRSEYEWDGLRRRRTVYGSQRSRNMSSPSPLVPSESMPQHPPLGMSRFMTDEELAEHDRPISPALSSLVGTIRGRTRLLGRDSDPSKMQSPLHPVQLTEIAVPTQQRSEGDEASRPYYGQENAYGLPSGKTAYDGSGADMSDGGDRHVKFGGDNRLPSRDSEISATPPTPPPHIHSAKRQFSFQNVFKRSQAHAQASSSLEGGHHEGKRPVSSSRGYSAPQTKDATEEERLGLVKGDSRNSQSMPTLRRYGSEDDDEEEDEAFGESYVDDKQLRYGRDVTNSPPRRGSNETVEAAAPRRDGSTEASQTRPRTGSSDGRGRSDSDNAPPQPAQRRHSPPKGGNGGAFI